MRWSQYFIPTLKECPAEADAISHKLMIRAGLIRKLTSGAYTYLPLGLRVLKKVESIIREEMDKKGAIELFLPSLQPIELWYESGRYKDLGEDLIKFKDRHNRTMVFGPTHEEVITDIVRNHIKSYRQLPIILYQIQTKFRDEVRPRFGIMRSREFIMKDAYSFDKDEKGLDESYKKMYEAYDVIFKRNGLKAIAVEADSGVMGGKVSHEFMVLAESGEDTLAHCLSCGYAASAAMASEKDICPKCGKKIKVEHAIEMGHVFKLGVKYSKAMKAEFLDEDSMLKPFVMGCYGIGVNRIIAANIEKHNDEKGIIWPVSIAPFQVIVIPLNYEKDVIRNAADNVYERLEKKGIEVLLDDRNESAGVKFNDAELIGIPFAVIIGERGLKKGIVEIKDRATGKIIETKEAQAVDVIKKKLEDETYE